MGNVSKRRKARSAKSTKARARPPVTKKRAKRAAQPRQQATPPRSNATAKPQKAAAARKPAEAPLPEPAPSETDGRGTQHPRFPVVGIGASAGGLEALEQFLAHVGPKGGAAYVVVQHLDPTHPDMLVELLQRVSKVQVLRA